MQIFVQTLVILWICTTSILGDCNVCQRNFVACHKENVYSLCINGIPTKDFITCPETHVCTDGPYVCYPRLQKQPSCTQNKNLCGVCSDNKVYACVNETTIAFCYGQDKPVEGADVSYCLGDTVCDIYSTKGFCTERYLVQPSCVPEITTEPTITTLPTTTISTTITKEPTTTTATTEPTTTTIGPTTTTEAKTTTTTTTTELTTTTTAATTETSTATTTTEPITTTIITTAEPTTTATTEPTTTTTTTTTTEPTTTTTTTTTTEPTTTTTTTTTTEPTTTTSTTTTESTTTTTTTETPLQPRDPNTICKDAGTTGSFYADDPTCTSFIVCYMMSGKIYGLKKACPSGQYFPPAAEKCEANKPDICI